MTTIRTTCETCGDVELTTHGGGAYTCSVKIKAPKAIAPREAIVPVRPMTAVSAKPRSGAEELATMIGQDLPIIVR